VLFFKIALCNSGQASEADFDYLTGQSLLNFSDIDVHCRPEAVYMTYLNVSLISAEIRRCQPSSVIVYESWLVLAALSVVNIVLDDVTAKFPHACRSIAYPKCD